MNPPLAYPTLETARLTLRGPTIADFEDSAAMWSEPAVVRHIGGRVFNTEECWARLLRYVGQWQLRGFGMWIIRDKAGAFVGEAGFLDARREIEPPLVAPEVGWALMPRAHGRGYATEAVTAALAWGEQHFGHGAFQCLIDPPNTASIRVAEKVGFREQLRTRYHGGPTTVYLRG